MSEPDRGFGKDDGIGIAARSNIRERGAPTEAEVGESSFLLCACTYLRPAGMNTEQRSAKKTKPWSEYSIRTAEGVPSSKDLCIQE